MPKTLGKKERKKKKQSSTKQKQTMAMSSSHQTFVTGNPLAPIHSHKHKSYPIPLLSCKASMEKDKEDPSSGGNEMPLAKLAIVTFAAGVLALGSVHEATAAKTGGRVGGQAFRSAAPRASSPRINNSRTNVYINPPIAPPLVGGYGFGGPYYGGWGWSPFTFFAPGPSVAVGIGGGFEIILAFVVLSTIATVIRRFSGRKDYDEDD